MPLPPSAADWTRFQRLRQSVASPLNDLTAASRAGNPFNPETTISRVAGGVKTRREASKWIDHKAALRSDFVTVKETFPNTKTRTLYDTSFCPSCVTTVLPTKVIISKNQI